MPSFIVKRDANELLDVCLTTISYVKFSTYETLPIKINKDVLLQALL